MLFHLKIQQANEKESEEQDPYCCPNLSFVISLETP